MSVTKLDRNDDGKLTRDELAPRRRGPGGDARRFNPETFIARMMERDKDEDGKLSKDELPERMQRGFDRMDKNGDGYLTRDELEQMSHRFSGRRGGDRPGGGDDSDRPRRPRRPERPE